MVYSVHNNGTSFNFPKSNFYKKNGDSVEVACEKVDAIASLLFALKGFRGARELVLIRCNRGQIRPDIAMHSKAKDFVITGGHEVKNVDFLYQAKEKPTSLVITGAHSLRDLSPSPDCKNCSEDRLSDLKEIVLTGAHKLKNLPNLENLPNLNELTITGGDRFEGVNQIKECAEQFDYINLRYSSKFDDYVVSGKSSNESSKS